MLGVLGWVLYCRRNRARILALTCTIVLAVMEVSSVSLLTGSMLGQIRLTTVSPFRDFTQLVASRVVVPPRVAAAVASRRQTRLVVPLIPEVIRVNTLVGPGTRNVFAVPAQLIPWFLQRIGERLQSGRLPRSGAAEIALPQQVMRSRHLRVGQWVGQQVDPTEWLPGRFRIVGVLSGTLTSGVAPYEAMRAVTPLRDVPGTAAYGVFARPGQLHRLDGYLDTLPLSEVRVYTHAAEAQQFRSEVRLLNWLIWSINLVTVGVLSLAMGLLNNLYYIQRMEEYGILSAIGYTHGLLVRRALVEVAAVTAVAWAAGIGSTAALSAALERFVFGPYGIHLPQINGHDIVATLPIPLCIGAFTVVTVLRRLVRLDPVAVVERRD